MDAINAIGGEFGPALVRGLAEWGPFPPPGHDLSLELGVSTWLHDSGSGLDDACATLRHVRAVVLDVADLDAVTEPVPLVGCSRELDLVHLVAYLDSLLVRAARSAGCDTRVLAERVIRRLRPDPATPSVAC